MAAITSQISKTMIENSAQQDQTKPDSHSSDQAMPQTAIEMTDKNAEDIAPGELTQSEVEAIQQAILGEEFDFSLLEAPAAGNSAEQALNQSAEKTFSSPLLLQDDDLLISFRHDASIARESQTNEISPESLTNLNASIRQDFGETTLPESQANPEALPDTGQISGFLSEDFATQTQGSFDTELGISPQVIDTDFGTFTSTSDGLWSYQLNNSSSEVQSLAAGQTISDRVSLSASNGENLELVFSIQGNNDQAVISGQKAGTVQAIALTEQAEATSISGTLNVSDIDNAESAFIPNTSLSGSFGSAEINGLGEWRYELNNNSEAVMGLKSGEKLFDLFSVKTLDGSKQLIQITIEGSDDTPVLGGNNLGILDLETQLSSSGSLTITDPDFGESIFQEAGSITSTLGYGVGSINAQGEWQYNLDTNFAQANPIGLGESRVDSFDVLTADGTSQTILIPIQGSDQPLFAQSSTNSLQLSELLSNDDILDEFNAPAQSGKSDAAQATETLVNSGFHDESSNHYNPSHSLDIGLI